MKKTTKRALSLILCIAMFAAFGLPAFAVEEDVLDGRGHAPDACGCGADHISAAVFAERDIIDVGVTPTRSCYHHNWVNNGASYPILTDPRSCNNSSHPYNCVIYTIVTCQPVKCTYCGTTTNDLSPGVDGHVTIKY